MVVSLEKLEPGGNTEGRSCTSPTAMIRSVELEAGDAVHVLFVVVAVSRVAVDPLNVNATVDCALDNLVVTTVFPDAEDADVRTSSVGVAVAPAGFGRGASDEACSSDCDSSEESFEVEHGWFERSCFG